MKLTKQRQAYVAVLGLGLVGLVLDRTMLSPAGAEAAAEPAEATPVAEAEPQTAAAASVPARPTLADRLREVETAHGLSWGEERVRDAFRPSDAWRADLSHTEPAEAVDPSVQVADLFRQKFRLHAVVTGPTGGLARLAHDGGEEMVKVGQVLDGIELVSLDARTATFRTAGGGEEFRLELVAPQLKLSSEVGAGKTPGAAPDPGGSDGL